MNAGSSGRAGAPGDIVEQLRRLDSCAVASAIESTGIRMRNEGFMDSSIRCLSAGPEPLVAYAFPLRISTAEPPMQDPFRARFTGVRNDWWENLLGVPAPRVLAVEDIDRHPGMGAFLGEVHANIFKALGCVGVVTNGAVRNLPAVQALGFHVFASNVTVSHAYMHIVEAGEPVRIGGLTVRTGDLLHGDQHGVLSIPPQIAGQLPQIAARQRREKSAIIDFCRSPEFSIEGLRRLLKANRD